MNLKLLAILALGLFGLFLAPESARADAAPPFGLWTGKFDDGSGTFAILVKSNREVIATVNGVIVANGYGDWDASSRGGILTISYPGVGGGVYRIYYSVTYVDSRTIILSDPYFKVKLGRQP